MVSAATQVSREGTGGATATRASRRGANLNARISAFLVDTVVLVAFILAFFVASGALLLFASDLGKNDAPDWATYAFVALFSGGLQIAWTGFNLGLVAWRGQTAGKYVLGVKTVSEDLARLSRKQLLIRWFGLHPLLFHPFLALQWAIVVYLAFAFGSAVGFALSAALVLLCLVAPVVALLAALFDAERRSLHDRLAGTLVVHMDQP